MSVMKKNKIINEIRLNKIKKVDEDVNLVKEKIKHPLKSYKELWNSMPENNKKLLILLLIVPWVIIFIVLLIVLIGMFLFK